MIQARLKLEIIAGWTEEDYAAGYRMLFLIMAGYWDIIYPEPWIVKMERNLPL